MHQIDQALDRLVSMAIDVPRPHHRKLMDCKGLCPDALFRSRLRPGVRNYEVQVHPSRQQSPLTVAMSRIPSTMVDTQDPGVSLPEFDTLATSPMPLSVMY